MHWIPGGKEKGEQSTEEAFEDVMPKSSENSEVCKSQIEESRKSQER